MTDGGKGSAPRPLGVDWNKFEENWDAIFGSNTDSVPDRNRDGAQSGAGDGGKGVAKSFESDRGA